MFDERYNEYSYGKCNRRLQVEKNQCSKISHEAMNSIVEGEKLLGKYRNRGLTKDTRATFNTVLDNRTLTLIKKLKETLLNDMHGVISAGKEAFVFSAFKRLNEEEIKGVKKVLIQLTENVQSQKWKHQETNIEVKGIKDEKEEEEEKNNKRENMEIMENDQTLKIENMCFGNKEDTQDITIDIYNDTDMESDMESDMKSGIENDIENDMESDIESEKEDIIVRNNLNNIKNENNNDFDLIEALNNVQENIEEINTYILNNVENKITISLAVKIYNTSVLVFKKRSTYVEGEFRFRNAYTKNTNPRKMVKQWAEKEFRNLRRIIVSGLRCPYPLVLRSNIVVMSMVGNLSAASLKIKDIQLSLIKWKELYIEAICILRLLFSQCKLVHADFSEYNLLYFYNHLFIIDVSQAMENDHPSALEFLKRDCVNVNRFFKQKLEKEDDETDKEEQENLKENLKEKEKKIRQEKEQKEMEQKEIEQKEMEKETREYMEQREMEKETRKEKEKKEEMEIKEIKPTTQIEPKNQRHNETTEIYDGVNILPLKKLFDFIISPELPTEIKEYLEKKETTNENEKEKKIRNYADIMYIKIYELLENCSMPIAKLKIEDIENNRVFFEKLKEATAYYVTKFYLQKERKESNENKRKGEEQKQKKEKKKYREEMEERLFLQTWIPSYLNEFTDVALIEKDMKLAKKGKSMANHFLVNVVDSTQKKEKTRINRTKQKKKEKDKKEEEEEEKESKVNVKTTQTENGDILISDDNNVNNNNVNNNNVNNNNVNNNVNNNNNNNNNEDMGDKYIKDKKKKKINKLEIFSDLNSNSITTVKINSENRNQKEIKMNHIITNGKEKGKKSRNIHVTFKKENYEDKFFKETKEKKYLNGNEEKDEDDENDENDEEVEIEIEKEEEEEEEEEEEAKFTGIIPEGITRKEWKKMVKEMNREKRKYKKPKYLKRVKNKKKNNTRK